MDARALLHAPGMERSIAAKAHHIEILENLARSNELVNEHCRLYANQDIDTLPGNVNVDYDVSESEDESSRAESVGSEIGSMDEFFSADSEVSSINEDNTEDDGERGYY